MAPPQREVGERMAEQAAVQARAKLHADGTDASVAGKQADKAFSAARERRIAAEADLQVWTQAEAMLVQAARHAFEFAGLHQARQGDRRILRGT